MINDHNTECIERIKPDNIIGGKYLIKELLGSGGEGNIYKVQDIHLGRTAALKEVITSDRNADRSLRREMEIMRELGGRNIGLPEIYDWVEENGEVYLVMEYIEGITLSSYIKWNSRLNEKKAGEWGREILEILAFLHEQQPPVIYQDLKASNIIVTKEGKVRIIDFGASFRMRFDGMMNRTAGTYGYAAPEQYRQECDELIGPQCDVYAWGKLMQEMLSGIDMGTQESCSEQAEAVYGGEISYAMDRIIRKCLSQRKGERYSTARDVIDAMDSEANTNRRYDLYIWGLKVCAALPAVTGMVLGMKERVFAHIMQLSFEDTGAWKMVFLSERKRLAVMAVMFLTSYLIYENIGVKYSGRIRRVDGIYLTECRKAGLWLVTIVLLAGICTGMIMHTKWIEAAGNLPITVYDNEGRKVLIRNGAVYGAPDDFIFRLDSDALGRPENGAQPAVLTVSLMNAEKGTADTRTYYLKSSKNRQCRP